MFPSWIETALYGAGGLVGIGLTLLYIFQEKLLYVPHAPGLLRDYSYSPNQVGLSYKDVWLETKDGLKLHGWVLWSHFRNYASIKECPVILFFQANAGNISHRLPFFYATIRRLDCVIITISYRGYGPSEGSPTEKGLKIDAETALELCHGLKSIDPSRIFVFGRSLGGAVALDLVSKHQDKFAGLIVENTFTSIPEMVPCMFPPLKPLMRLKPLAHVLVRNKWNNRNAIRKITRTPVLFLSSGQDEMVPPEQMKELHELCAAPESTFVSFPEAHHMSAFDEDPVSYWTAVKDFVNRHSNRKKHN